MKTRHAWRQIRVAFTSAIFMGGITTAHAETVDGVTEYSYDAAGRVVCTVVRMDSASFGNAASDACSSISAINGVADRITKSEYDVFGQVTQIRRAVGTSLEQAYATYTYTLNGKQEYVIDANGNRAQMVYDGFDRLSRWIFPSNAAPSTYAPGNQAGALEQAGAANTADYEEYTYDANGNRLTLRKRDGSTLSFEYDGLNRLTKKLVPERSGLSGAATRDVYYAYDLQGHQTDARFDSLTGEGLHATFDGLGREISNTLTMDNVGRSVSYQYDANSNRTMATQPDGAFARYAYDGLDRLKQAWWGWAGVSGEQLFSTVGYKANGLRDTIARGSSSTAYGYDNAQRLSDLSQSFITGTGNLAQTFAYNPAGQMTDESVSNNAYSYKARVNVNRAYGVNGLNQYNSIAGRSFCYDANGSLTADGTFVYLYDVENRLVEKRAQTNTDCSALAYTGSIKASLRYDPMGRLYETVGDVTGTTRMAYDGDKLIGEYNASGNLLRRYLWGDRTDEPLVWDEGGLLNCSGTRFLAGNHQGSIVATADCQGNLTRTFAYDEYGIPEAGDATPLTPANGARFLYTGQAFQPDLGMYYYKARMYSPTLGRFMQTDPIGYDDQINLYAYVGNDPVNSTDPTGQQLVIPVPRFRPLPGPFGPREDNNFDKKAAAILQRKFDDFSKSISDALNNNQKTVYATYTKEGDNQKTYSGRTSIRVSIDIPDRTAGIMAVARRQLSHHMDKNGYGAAEFDKASQDYFAIRGREQQLIDFYGGARSVGGTSGNAINGVSDYNPLWHFYDNAATIQFGRLPSKRP